MGHRQLSYGYGQRVDVATVAVDDEKTLEPKGLQGAHDAAKDTVICVVVEADRAAERKVVLAHAEPKARQNSHWDLVGYQLRRSDRGFAGAGCIGNHGQMRPMLFKRAYRKHC